MAETLGSLCDKLTIVKLKQWHTTDDDRLASLAEQAALLVGEIDSQVADAVDGRLPQGRITFPSNKVFDVGAAAAADVTGTLGRMVGELARVNCALWHEQEKVYEIQRQPDSHTDAVAVIRRLGALNLERTRHIDAIDRGLLTAIREKEEVS